jgi:hypothetical protein
VRQDVDDDKNDHVRVIALGFLVLQPEHWWWQPWWLVVCS